LRQIGVRPGLSALDPNEKDALFLSLALTLGVNGQQELTHRGHEELTHPGESGVGRAHVVGAGLSSLGSEGLDGAGPRSPGPRVTRTSAC
jgi:delta 1-pyrroline-5-carboxylate dehydrogenase